MSGVRAERLCRDRLYQGPNGMLRRIVMLGDEVPDGEVLWFEVDRETLEMTERCNACSRAAFARWARFAVREARR